MLSKAQSKHIRSLTQQKFRDEYQMFVAEGNKVALEWLQAPGNIHMIVTTTEWAEVNKNHITKHPEAEFYTVTEAELATLSSLHTPNQVLLVVPYPETKSVPIVNDWYLALDNIQDPGNMGTLIRIADWFGIKYVLCSPGCVDVLNPKVVQSAMGGHLRVGLFEADLTQALPLLPVPKIAATLTGINIYEYTNHSPSAIIIGNESKGVSEELLQITNHQLTIPARGGAESLNAAVSAGIICALLLPH